MNDDEPAYSENEVKQMMEDYGSEIQSNNMEHDAPPLIERDSQFKFLREILKSKESVKISNLTSEELGKSQISVRGCIKVSLISEMLGLKETSKYYKSMAETIGATSMSRKGTFLNLIFTQIRKTLSGSTNELTPQKRSMFSFGNKNNNTGDTE